MSSGLRTPEEAEHRLTALWENPHVEADDASVDDAIAALFSASDDTPPRTRPHDRPQHTRSNGYRSSRRDLRRPPQAQRADSQVTGRAAVIAVAMLAAIVSATITLSRSTGPADTTKPVPRAEANPTTLRKPPARPAGNKPELRRAPAVEPTQRRHERRAHAATARRKRSRADVDARATSTRVARPPRATRPHGKPEASHHTAPPRRSTAPTASPASSACDEFPPC